MNWRFDISSDMKTHFFQHWSSSSSSKSHAYCDFSVFSLTTSSTTSITISYFFFNNDYILHFKFSIWHFWFQQLFVRLFTTKFSKLHIWATASKTMLINYIIKISFRKHIKHITCNLRRFCIFIDLNFLLTSKLLYYFAIQNIIIIIFNSKNLFIIFSFLLKYTHAMLLLFNDSLFDDFNDILKSNVFKKYREKLRVNIRLNWNISKNRFATFDFDFYQWFHKHFSTQKIIDVELQLFINDFENDVICYICKIHICDWQKNDDFYEMYSKIFFECAWLKTHHETLMLIRKFACKRCFVKFSNNIKLHEHIRTKHAKKSKKTFVFSATSITFIFSFVIALITSFVSSSITSIKSTISIATSKKKYFDRK